MKSSFQDQTRWIATKKRTNQQTMTKMQSVQKAFWIHLQAEFQAIPPTCCQENAWKHQIWPVSLSQCGTKMRKISRPQPKSNQFWRCWAYICKPNFIPFLPYQSGVKIWKIKGKWQNLINSECGQNTSAWQISHHSSHVLSRKCPETSNFISWAKSETPKSRKSTDCDQNVNSAEGSQDTSTYQFSGHSFPAYSRKCMETYQDGWIESQLVTCVMVSRSVCHFIGCIDKWMYGRRGGQMEGWADNPNS